MIETILQILGVVSTGTSVVLGVFLFKFKRMKAANDANRDDIQLYKEQMKYIEELGAKTTNLYREVLQLRERIDSESSENKKNKSLADRIKKEHAKIVSDLEFFKKNCRCPAKHLSPE